MKEHEQVKQILQEEMLKAQVHGKGHQLLMWKNWICQEACKQIEEQVRRRGMHGLCILGMVFLHCFANWQSYSIRTQTTRPGFQILSKLNWRN